MLETSEREPLEEMDHLKGLSACIPFGEGQQDIVTEECFGYEGEDTSAEVTDHKKTADFPGLATDSYISKRSEASTGRERIRIIFKRKVSGEDHAVSVVLEPLSKKQTGSSPIEGFRQLQTGSDLSGPGHETKPCQAVGVVQGNCLRDTHASFVQHSLLPITPLPESECQLVGIGITVPGNEDGHSGVASLDQSSSVPMNTASVYELGKGSELMGSCIACLGKVGSITIAQDGCKEATLKESFTEDHATAAAVESGAITQGTPVNLESVHSDDSDGRPKARRTPLAFPSLQVHALEGETQVTVCSLSGSLNGHSIPLPAKRSPLPLPAVQSLMPLPRQKKMCSVESSVDVYVQPTGPGESMDNLNKLPCLQDLETKVDLQSMWLHHSNAAVTKHGFECLESADNDENISGLGEGLEETNHSSGKLNSRLVTPEVVLPAAETRPECRAPLCTPLDPMAQSSDVAWSTGLILRQHKFSFQRLVNGDITDIEDDDEEEIGRAHV